MAQHATSKKTKYGIVGAVGGVVLGTAAFAFAAALTTTTNSIIAGQASMTACDADGIDLALGQPTWNAGTGDYVITTVTVTGLDTEACDTKKLQIDVTDSANASLGTVTHTIATGVDPGTLTLSGPVSASSADGVASVIY